MKRFLFLSMTVFIAVMVWVSIREKEDDRPLPQKLEQAIRLTRMKEYHDDDYDYVVRYPAFFEQTPDSLLDKGNSRFSFWQDSIEIVQTTFVEPNTNLLNVREAMEKYASKLHATQQRLGEYNFILSGTLYTDSGIVSGRRFYAKFVQHRKLWFVQTLTYPEDCESALKRLKDEIYKWQVW